MDPEQTPMWDGQRAFRHLAQADAIELFREIDEALEPRVFLVGIRWDQAREGPEVCIEPADHAGITRRLAGVREAASVPGIVELAATLSTDPRLATDHANQATRVGLLRSLQRAFGLLDGDDASVSFCSLPQPVGAYMVSTVLRFDRAQYAVHGAPVQGPAAEPAGALFRTLVDAAADELLAECSLALTGPERGRYGVASHEIPDMLRAAGKKLMHSPGHRMQGMLDLYDICNMVSTLRYEGRDSVGTLMVAPRGEASVRVDLALRQPVSVREYRTLRKLLEITDEHLVLLCADGDVYGLGSVPDGAEPDVGHFVISFTGHQHWRLARGDRVLMEVSYGQPRLPKERLDRKEFLRLVGQAFGGFDTVETAHLWRLVAVAAGQRHGTIVVVSAGAEREAERLSQQGISIEPVPLSPELMRLVTAIDGAVLIDPHNRCHAIGTILDGRATESGDSSRGARYNSALRYVESSEAACLAIVVSEDGMIDLVSSAHQPAAGPARAQSA